jgi:Protein of unknown function (DUF2852)
MSTTAEMPLHESHDEFRRSHNCSRGKKGKWAGLEIAAMVGGFVVFWPVGLGLLALKLVKGSMWPGASDGKMPWDSLKTAQNFSGTAAYAAWQNTKSSAAPSSGNAAFDAYKKQQLERLEAERRKLEEEQLAFADYLAKLRQAKDQDEFDRFMAEHLKTNT